MRPETKVRKMRKMSSEQSERMRRGRERSAREREAREDAMLAEFTAWLSVDSSAFARYRECVEMFGADHPETIAARAAWHAAAAQIPQLPPDSAYRRARGD